MTQKAGKYFGIWKQQEPETFYNFGIHIDLENKNIMLFFIHTALLIGKTKFEVDQPHLNPIMAIEVPKTLLG